MRKAKGIRISPTATETLKNARRIKNDALATGVYDNVRILQRGHTYRIGDKTGYPVWTALFEVKGYDYA